MRPSDYTIVSAKLRELHKEHSLLRTGYYEDVDVDRFFKLLDQSTLKIVAVDDSENVIGFVRGEIINNKEKSFAVIHDIFINSSERSKGIGSLLMKNFYDEVKKTNISNLRLQVDILNDGAISFWKNEGFETTHLKMERSI